MSQSYFYPPAGVNASVSTNGGPIAAQSTLIAGEDPSGNQVPVSVSSTGEVNIATAGPLDANVNIVEIVGAAPSATNSLPTQLTDGSSFYDARQIRALTSADVVTVDQGTIPWDVSVSASVLPTGAATAANQATEITSLGNIDTSTSAINTKTPTLGQKTMAGSVPVVVASDQSSLPVTVGNFPATQPVSGTVTANQGTTPWVVGQSTAANLNATVVQATGTNLHTVIDSGTVVVTQSTASNLKTQSFAGTPTAGTVTQAAITVGTSAVRLTVSGSAPSATRSVLMVIPDAASTAKFYIGSSSVTNSSTTRGFQIVSGMSFIANSDANDYYIISDTAAQTVYVTEVA